MTTNEIDSSNPDSGKTNALSHSVTREDLYELVWSESMLKVAARYGVSSSYMARVCTLLNVPRPERGYWAKLAVGKADPKPPLPDARPGDELVWSKGGGCRSKNKSKLRPHPPSRAPKRRKKKMKVFRGHHLLINGAKELFERGRLSREVGYLKPFKKLLVDLVVTKTGIDKALTFANQLFSLLEEYGYRVVIAPNGEQLWRADVDECAETGRNRGYDKLWTPYRCTVVYIGTVAIGLTIIEMSEEIEARYVNGKYIREKDYVPPKRKRYGFNHTWTTKHSFPTGRLRLQAYSPYPRTKWVKRWQETKNHDLSKKIKGIVKELEDAAVEIAQLVEEANRQFEREQKEWEAHQKKWQKEMEEQRVAKALKDSREELFQIINHWAETNRIEKFFQDVERRAANLNENDKSKILDRIKLAREMVGSVDALDHFIEWQSPDER